jgi:hypothetical protein
MIRNEPHRKDLRSRGEGQAISVIPASLKACPGIPGIYFWIPVFTGMTAYTESCSSKPISVYIF